MATKNSTGSANSRERGDGLNNLERSLFNFYLDIDNEVEDEDSRQEFYRRSHRERFQYYQSLSLFFQHVLAQN